MKYNSYICVSSQLYNTGIYGIIYLRHGDKHMVSLVELMVLHIFICIGTFSNYPKNNMDLGMEYNSHIMFVSNYTILEFMIYAWRQARDLFCSSYNIAHLYMYWNVFKLSYKELGLWNGI